MNTETVDNAALFRTELKELLKKFNYGIETAEDYIEGAEGLQVVSLRFFNRAKYDEYLITGLNIDESDL